MYTLDQLDPKEWIIMHQEKVMGHYLQLPITSTLVVSPLRLDTNPTCSFYYGQSGRLYFHDFGIEKSYDVFDVVMTKFGLSFKEAMNKIISEKDSFADVTCNVKKREGDFKFIIGEDENKYFSRFFISRDTLIKFGVYSLSSVYLNGKLISRSTKTNPIYAYRAFSGRIKTYRPLTKEKKEKWGGNTNAEDIWGDDILPYRGKLLLITSSAKDAMVLAELGFNAIAFNGEGYGTSDSEGSKYISRKILQYKRRFEYILFFMDNDKAGINYSHKLSYKYNLPYIVTPNKKPKDISDFILKYKLHVTFRTLKKMIAKAFKNNAKSNVQYPTIEVPY